MMGMGMVLSSAVLWAQPAVPGNVPVMVNRVMAVVGGSQVITLEDVRKYRVREMIRAKNERRNPPPVDDELALGELINDALFVHEIRHRKGFVMPDLMDKQCVIDQFTQGQFIVHGRRVAPFVLSANHLTHPIFSDILQRDHLRTAHHRHHAIDHHRHIARHRRLRPQNR
jgi:hypothetical protein